MDFNFWRNEKNNTEKYEYRQEKVVVEESTTPEEDIFWIQLGKDTIKDTIEVLDERAKYFITTCASLIIIHFGLLLAFKVQSIAFRVTPEFFFVVAAALLAVSLYPVARPIEVQSPNSIKKAYSCWIKWKLMCHRVGSGFFIVGLFALTITVIFQHPVTSP